MVGSQVESDNNRVRDRPTQLLSTCNSHLGNFARTSISFVLFDRESLKNLLSNNPVFLEGHFVRVEPLEVICLYGLRSNLRVICSVWHLRFLPVICLSAHSFIIHLNPLTSGAFGEKGVFWTFWWFLGWISVKLPLIWSKMHLHHDTLVFVPLASRFATFWLGHAQKSIFWILGGESDLRL